jgi:hypothetical protein
MNSLVVLYNPEARQSLVVIYSREHRSVGSPLSAKQAGKPKGLFVGKWSLVNKAL